MMINMSMNPSSSFFFFFFFFLGVHVFSFQKRKMASDFKKKGLVSNLSIKEHDVDTMLELFNL